MENLAGVEILEETREGGLGTGQDDEVGIGTDLVYEARQPQSSPGMTESLRVVTAEYHG